MTTTLSPPSPPTRQPVHLFQKLGELYARRETIRFLVTSNLKAGHRDKALGRLWGLLDPLLFMLVYLVIFGFSSFRQVHDKPGGTIEFILFLLCGIISWRFFDGALNSATNCIRANRGLIHEINFPKAIFPTSACLARLSDFFWGLVALFVIMLAIGRQHFTPFLLWVPFIVLVQLVFTLGLSYLIAFLGAFFADTANLVAVGLRFLFYFSPIFYRVSKAEGGIIPDKYLTLFMLNPIACFFEAYRDCILRGHSPDPEHLLYVVGLAVVAFFGGFYVFIRGEGHFAKYI